MLTACPFTPLGAVEVGEHQCLLSSPPPAEAESHWPEGHQPNDQACGRTAVALQPEREEPSLWAIMPILATIQMLDCTFSNHEQCLAHAICTRTRSFLSCQPSS